MVYVCVNDIFYEVRNMIVMEKVVVMSLGERLKTYRVLQGLTQSALAREAHISPSDISRIENDLSPKVAAFTLLKIARALGVTTAHLLGEVDFLQTFNIPDGE